MLYWFVFAPAGPDPGDTGLARSGPRRNREVRRCGGREIHEESGGRHTQRPNPPGGKLLFLVAAEDHHESRTGHTIGRAGSDARCAAGERTGHQEHHFERSVRSPDCAGTPGGGRQSLSGPNPRVQECAGALVGAQYVLLSNNAKNSPNFELRVTIGQAGTLYLILDNRVGTNSRDPTISPDLSAARMYWVNDLGFFNTGMKMALDENADGSANNYYSVYSLQVTPGVVVLKAQFDRFIGGPQDRNMYSVAAATVRKATNPIPGDGKTVAASRLLQWTPGVGAAFHNVYVGTSPQLGPADLVGPYVSHPFFEYPLELIPDTTYYWRVDEIEADKTTVTTGDVWTFKVTSAAAFGPVPVNGAPWVDLDTTLSWKPGMSAFLHNLYFGTDKAAVENGTGGTFRGTVFSTTWTAAGCSSRTRRTSGESTRSRRTTARRSAGYGRSARSGRSRSATRICSAGGQWTKASAIRSWIGPATGIMRSSRNPLRRGRRGSTAAPCSSRAMGTALCARMAHSSTGSTR